MHFTVTIYYTIISKFQKFAKKFKNSPIAKKSTSHVANIIHNASMEFEHYPIITVGEDAFFSFYMLYGTITSKFQKFAKNTKIVRSSKKAQARLLISYLMPVWNLNTIQ